MRLILLFIACFGCGELSAQSYFIHFPDDLLITNCSLAPSEYDRPEVFNPNNDSIVITYYDSFVTWAPTVPFCYGIERNWIVALPGATLLSEAVFIPNPTPSNTIYNPVNLPGPVVSPANTPAPWAPTIVKINPTDPAPTNYSTFWNSEAVKYHYTQSIRIFDLAGPASLDSCQISFSQTDSTDNDIELWNDPAWNNPTTLSSNLPEMPVDLSFTSRDDCSSVYDLTPGFILYFDLDNNGTWETTLNSINLLPAGSTYVNNLPFGGPGPIAIFDNRNVPQEEKYRFKIQKTYNADNSMTARLVWVTDNNPSLNKIPELPRGKHKISWSSWDRCNNEALCEQEFEVALDPTVPNGTTAAEIAALQHRIMPNPVSGSAGMTIGGPSISEGYLELTSVLGQSALRTVFSGNNVPLNGILPGIYGYSIIENGRLTGLGTIVITE
jgi:hypothetical protein